MNDAQGPNTPSRVDEAKASPSLGCGSAVIWSLIAALGINGMAIAY
jgi:hypothetical protein